MRTRNTFEPAPAELTVSGTEIRVPVADLFAELDDLPAQDTNLCLHWLFVPPRPRHQLPNRLFRALAPVQNRVHLLRNRHLHPIASRQPQRRRRAREPPPQPCPADRPESPPARVPLPSSIPTVRFRESDPVQVSTRSPIPDKPASVCLPPAARHRQPRNLRNSARNQRRRRSYTPGPAHSPRPRPAQSHSSAIRPAPRPATSSFVYSRSVAELNSL